MPNFESYLNTCKEYFKRLYLSATGGQSIGITRMVPGFLLALLIGFAITWVYLFVSNRSNQPESSSTQQLEQAVAAASGGEDSVAIREVASNGDYVPEVKKEVSESPSENGWSADSFLDVAQDPESTSDLTSAVKSVAKKANSVQRDPYLESLVGEADNLQVLATDSTANAIGASDQAALDSQSSGSRFTSNSPIRFSPDGLILVQRGDTLSIIAQKLYGDVLAYDRIFNENRDVLDDPDELAVGVQLRIPELAK